MVDIMEQLTRAVNNTLSYRPQNRDITGENLYKLYEKFKSFCEIGVEVTITFRPELSNRYNSVTLTKMVNDMLCKCRIRHHFYCMFIGEFSDVGHYHLHGVFITSGRTMSTIGNKLKREFGRTEIKNIRHTTCYAAYVFKYTENTDLKKTDELPGYKSDGLLLRKVRENEIIYIQ